MKDDHFESFQTAILSFIRRHCYISILDIHVLNGGWNNDCLSCLRSLNSFTPHWRVESCGVSQGKIDQVFGYRTIGKRTRSNVPLPNDRKKNSMERSFGDVFSVYFQSVKAGSDYPCVIFLVSGVSRYSPNNSVSDIVRFSSIGSEIELTAK